MNKKLLSVILSGVLCIGLLVGCNKKEEVEDDTKPDNTVEESIKEIDDTNEPDKSDVTKAYDELKPIVDNAFSDIRHELMIKDNNIILFTHLSKDDIMATTENEWNELVDTAVAFEKQYNSYLSESGNSARLVICVADLDTADIYLVVQDNEVTSDKFDGNKSL